MTEKEKIEIVKNTITLQLPKVISGAERAGCLRDELEIRIYWVKNVIRIDIKGFKKGEGILEYLRKKT